MGRGKRVVVGAAAVKIADKGTTVVVRNRDAANDVDLGGPGVTAGTGYRLLHTDTLATTVDCSADELWAIRAGAVDVTIDVLIARAGS